MGMCCFQKNRLVVFLFFFSLLTFSTEKDPFSFSLSKKLKYFKYKEDKKIIKSFIKKWDSNSFSSHQKELITHYVSDFENRSFNQEFYIYFFSFCNYLIDHEPGSLSNWLNSSLNYLSDFSDKDLVFFLMTNNNIVQDQLLFKKQDFSWSFSGECDLFFQDNIPYYKLVLDSLILFNKYHEIIFHDTKIEFDLFEKKIYGHGGYLGWDELTSKQRRVELDSFELDLTKRKIDIQNVKLVNTIYFTLESQGNFIDYLSRSKNKSSYPKFYAKQEAVTSNFFNGFSCFGGVNILGKKIYFKSIDQIPVKLLFSNDYINAEFICNAVKLQGSSLSSDKVSANFYLGVSDSIYHPEMNFFYNDTDKQLSLKRIGDTYLSDRPILNSFHGLNIYADFLKLNVQENKFFFADPCFNQKNYVLFESVDYYDDARYNDLGIFSSKNMLDILFDYMDKNEKRKNISISEFSYFLNIDFYDAMHIIKSLEIFDFVVYNDINKQFDVKNRVYNFFNSKKKKYDYDQFSIRSFCFLGDTIASFDVEDMSMSVFNVNGLQFQPDSKYKVFLKDDDIHFFDDRSFSMNGKLNFDNFSISSDSIIFKYKDFSLYFPTFSDFKIINKNLPKDSECIENIVFKNGLLQLDTLINKSGFSQHYDFPKFHFSDSSYVFGKDKAVRLNLDSQVINYFDEIALKNLEFNGSLSIDNSLEEISGDVNLNLESGLDFYSKVEDAIFFKNHLFTGDLYFNGDELNASGTLSAPNFEFKSDRFLINSFRVFSKSGNLDFNTSTNFSFIDSDYISMDYVLGDSIIFSSNKKSLFNLYERFHFVGDVVFDLNSINKDLFAKGHFLGDNFNIFSDLFLFSKESFIAGNSDVTFFSDDQNDFVVNGVSIEFLVKSDSLLMLREDLKFKIPFMNTILDFQASLMDFQNNQLTFFNLDNSKGLFSYKNDLNYTINSVLLDVPSKKVFLNTDSFIKIGLYTIYPQASFIELGVNGIPLSFIAKKIKKKRMGKDVVFLQKKVSFDEKMNCYIED